MKSHRYYRAARKLVRPIRRVLQSSSPCCSPDDFSSSVMVLIAHPDDEVFCSGLICELLSMGKEVHLVSMTRGEGGERGEIADGAKLASVRERELDCAAEALEVTSLTFLDYLDPISETGELSEPEHDSSELLAELSQLLASKNAEDLVTHGSSGEYWHPAHLCLHRHARLLTRRLANLQLWTFNAWSPQHPLPAVLNQDDVSNLSLDGSAYQEKRLRSLSCHFSQKDVFQRFANGTLEDFIKLTTTENYRKR
ncbi:PIG-L deacetylase family protein [Roseibacillus persicicus]|uniref:PIG-L deacetylase family protein n=1 Tax=Roseibacillus persicicus TaxID=454148 RepID=UPI00398B02AE